MPTPAPVTHDSEFIARKMTAAADNHFLWRHVEQELLEFPYQNKAYFDVIMRLRFHRPVRRLPLRVLNSDA